MSFFLNVKNWIFWKNLKFDVLNPGVNGAWSWIPGNWQEKSMGTCKRLTNRRCIILTSTNEKNEKGFFDLHWHLVLLKRQWDREENTGIIWIYIILTCFAFDCRVRITNIIISNALFWIINDLSRGNYYVLFDKIISIINN